LAAGNLLIRSDRIVGVLDWGGLAVGDPACDLMPAWTLFSGSARVAFKRFSNADDDTWRRALGWTLSVAVIAIPYYLSSAPRIVEWATNAIEQVLADPEQGGTT
jgi:aminoglycoside phosphotransferase (APT) family kinase protein